MQTSHFSMEEEVQKVLLASDTTTSSSDNESWTILDEEEEETSPQVSAIPRLDVVQNLAAFTHQAQPVQSFESDSDIEPAEEDSEDEQERHETNLDSLNSDGIPVGEELSETGAQYLWTSETDSGKELLEATSENDDLEIIDNMTGTLKLFLPFQLLLMTETPFHTFGRTPNPKLKCSLRNPKVN